MSLFEMKWELLENPNSPFGLLLALIDDLDPMIRHLARKRTLARIQPSRADINSEREEAS